MKVVSLKHGLIAIACSLAMASLSVNAKDPYWGIDVGMHEIDVGFEFDVVQLQGVYGWQTSHKFIGDKPLGIEFRGSIGVDDDGVELTYTAGAYVRQEFNIGSSITPYVVAGIAHAKADAGGLGSGTETGLSFGVGAWYELQNGLTLSLEYMPQLVDDVSGFNIGVRF